MRTNKDKILDLSRKYIDEQKKVFVPGETYIPSSGNSWNGDDIASIVGAALDKWLTDGKEAYEFERLLATTVKQRHAVLCNSGSSANLLAMSALMSKQLKGKELKLGDEVITVACGFPTTVNPIIQNGLVPVFVDIHAPQYNALPNSIEEAISDKTRAIFIAHTLGNPYKAKEIRDIADQNGLWVIADCCFVAGTMIKTSEGDKPIENVKVGDLVLTRRGYKKVTRSEKTGKKKVITSMGLTGTPNHPVITKYGIRSLDALGASDIIYTWNQKQSSITEQSIQDSQTLLNVTLESTIGVDQKENQNPFTDRYTWTTTERYRMGLTFITLIETHLTMTLPILRQFREKSILETISKTMDGKRSQTEILNLQERGLETGTKTPPTGSFTLELLRSLGKISQRLRRSVRFAEKNIKHFFRPDQKTAQENVKTEAEVYNLCVEDCHEYFANNILVHNCDALGAEHHGQPLPFWADISTFSFYPAHHISMAEGGAVTTNSPQLNKIIRSLRDWGRDCWCATGKDNTCGKRYGWKLGDLPIGFDHKYIYSEIGYNLKATDLQAAIGTSQLKRLSSFVFTRRENWSFYRDCFNDLKEFFVLPEPTAYSNPSWFGFMMMVKESAPFSRTDLVKYLEENKVGTRMLFAGNLTKQPAYKDVKFRVSDTLTVTDRVMNSGFWLGVFPGISRPMQEYVVEKMLDFAKNK